jgi:hypothetical protein
MSQSHGCLSRREEEFAPSRAKSSAARSEVFNYAQAGDGEAGGANAAKADEI